MKYMKLVVGIITLLVIVYAVRTNHAEASTKKYLVLVQEDSNKWIAYDNLTEVTTNGSTMLKAKQFSDIMDFTYAKNTSKKQFSIKRSKGRYNTYTTNSTKYTYTSKGKTTNKKAKFKSYKSKIDNSNLCIAESVKSLCNYRIFTGDGIQEYQDIGYDGVLCYSLKERITKVPNILYVRYSDGTGLKKRLSSDVIYADVDADGYVNITLLDSVIDGMPVVYQVGDENVLTCSWGEFSNDIAPLYVHVKSVGMTFINVFLEDYSEYITIVINVKSVPGSMSTSGSSSWSLPIYVADSNYRISGTLTCSSSSGQNFYIFSGTITNLTPDEISLGSSTLNLNTSEGLWIYNYRINILALKPGMSWPISCVFYSEKKCENVTMSLSTAYH